MSSDATVKTEIQGALGIIALSGDISGTADETIRSAYDHIAKAGAKKILLRFGQGCYINSAGIAVLILIVSDAKKSKQKVGAVGLTAHFKKIFDMIGLTDYITVFDSEDEAKKKL